MPLRSSPDVRCMAISVSSVWLPLEAIHQTRLTVLTPAASETCAVTVAGESGGGVLNVTSVMDGGTTLRKLSLRFPGEPAGRSSTGIVELAQFAGLSAGANGEMRSRDVECPSVAVG